MDIVGILIAFLVLLVVLSRAASTEGSKIAIVLLILILGVVMAS